MTRLRAPGGGCGGPGAEAELWEAEVMGFAAPGYGGARAAAPIRLEATISARGKRRTPRDQQIPFTDAAQRLADRLRYGAGGCLPAVRGATGLEPGGRRPRLARRGASEHVRARLLDDPLARLDVHGAAAARPGPDHGTGRQARRVPAGDRGQPRPPAARGHAPL